MIIVLFLCNSQRAGGAVRPLPPQRPPGGGLPGRGRPSPGGPGQGGLRVHPVWPAPGGIALKSVPSPRVADASSPVVTLEVPIQGLCCAEEAKEVRRAMAGLPGVVSVEVLLAAQKAMVRCRPGMLSPDAIREAVASAGCSVPAAFARRDHPEAAGPASEPASGPTPLGSGFGKAALIVFGAVFGVVLLVAVLGETLGLVDAVTREE
ncbi:MAG: heavy-metal-associated domain-containing protein [Bacteroidales bacterium]